MMLPRFNYVRQHTAAAHQICWEVKVDGIDFSGYTTNEGTARDIMVHLPTANFAVTVASIVI